MEDVTSFRALQFVQDHGSEGDLATWWFREANYVREKGVIVHLARRERPKSF